ncbi:MAG: ArsA family ATPase [bacterium]|nr:ArsA family ATPase [bacterium]
MNLLERIGGLRLILVSGKGGVGKSTLTAALGRCLSSAGRRVLLLEIDPRESLYPLLDVDPSGGEMQRVSPRLWVQNLRPREVLDQVVHDQLKIGVLARRVVNSPIYRQFAETAPGLEELAVLGHALRLVRGLHEDSPQPDVVLLDAPATGHSISLLAGPQLAAEVIPSGPFGEMASELAAFVADPRQAGIVLVTQAEELPISEAIDMLGQLDRRFGRGPELAVVNALYPPIPPGCELPQDGPIGLWRRRREANEAELRRFAQRWDGPRVDIPLLPFAPGPKLVERIGERLESSLDAVESVSCV